MHECLISVCESSVCVCRHGSAHGWKVVQCVLNACVLSVFLYVLFRAVPQTLAWKAEGALSLPETVRVLHHFYYTA